jgi:hypothetical protein
MILKCPLCGGIVNSKELRPQRGGFQCPRCNGGLTYAQGHAVLRRTSALIISILILVSFGVKNAVFLVVGSALLWPVTQIIVNGYSAYVTHPTLKPWSPPIRDVPLWKPEVPQVFKWNANPAEKSEKKPANQRGIDPSDRSAD